MVFQRFSCALIASVVLLLSHRAFSQDTQQRQAAANAYDRGSAAFLAEDYETAARWFETAHNLAPAPSALLQAARAHQAAGNGTRAATLALQLTQEFGGAAAHAGGTLLGELEPQFGRVDVECDGCAVQVDGELAPYTSVFVTPDAAHEIVLGFSTGDVERSATVGAGQRIRIEAEAPAAPEPAAATVTPAPRTAERAEPPPPERVERGGLPPALFAIALIGTVGAGATLVWSGLNVRSENDDYERAVEEGRFEDAQRLLDDGQSGETRTNALIGVTAGLGVLTIVFAAVTDWGGDDDDDRAGLGPGLIPSVGAQSGGGSLGLAGSF
ncbi:MAG: hypothetical protein AAF411_13770 [Myxococcota bacterium]